MQAFSSMITWKAYISTGSKKIALDNQNVMQPELSIGFEYSDCWVDDARLVVLNIIQARELGAEVSNYCQVTKARRENGVWHVEIHDLRSGQTFY